jgi:hypothetical protein
MRSFRNILTAVVVSGAALAAMPVMTGCTASAGYVVEEDPPPPREEVVAYRPGFVWVHGRWAHPGSRWVWQGGRYERERPNQVYVEGRWERRGHNRVWVDGGWHARGGVVVRERG